MADEAGRLIRRGGDIEDALRAIIDEMLQGAGPAPLDNSSVAEWFARWLKNQQGAVAEASLRRYEQALNSFLRFLGERKTLKLAALTSGSVPLYWRRNHRNAGLPTGAVFPPPDHTAQHCVEKVITDQTRVLVGHSLGTVVAYEALCAHPEWPVRTFVSLGSPLGISILIFELLRPAPEGHPAPSEGRETINLGS